MTQRWPIRLRKRLLVPGSHKWNGWVRDLTSWLEKPWLPVRRRVTYPHQDGDFLIIGPECFTYLHDHSVISWRGQNYVPQ